MTYAETMGNLDKENNLKQNQYKLLLVDEIISEEIYNALIQNWANEYNTRNNFIQDKLKGKK